MADVLLAKAIDWGEVGLFDDAAVVVIEGMPGGGTHTE
jgi:hypothetical protein